MQNKACKTSFAFPLLFVYNVSPFFFCSSYWCMLCVWCDTHIFPDVYKLISTRWNSHISNFRQNVFQVKLRNTYMYILYENLSTTINIIELFNEVTVYANWNAIKFDWKLAKCKKKRQTKPFLMNVTTYESICYVLKMTISNV